MAYEITFLPSHAIPIDRDKISPIQPNFIISLVDHTHEKSIRSAMCKLFIGTSQVFILSVFSMLLFLMLTDKYV